VSVVIYRLSNGATTDKLKSKVQCKVSDGARAGRKSGEKGGLKVTNFILTLKTPYWFSETYSL